MKTIITLLGILLVAAAADCADEPYDIKVKAQGAPPIIVTTNVTCFGSCADGGDSKVTAQLVGTNVVIVEWMVPAQGTSAVSVITTNIPVNSLPQTFTLSASLLGGGAEHARVTVSKGKPRSKDKERPEDAIKVGDDFAAAVKKIVAAGGIEDNMPYDPGDISVPVVDAKGHTNLVSRPAPYPEQFRMKDGRHITITPTLDEGKVSSIGVKPPLEIDDE